MCLHPGEALSVCLHALKKLLSQVMLDLEEISFYCTSFCRACQPQPVGNSETTALDKVMERARLLMTMEEQKHTAAVAETEESRSPWMAPAVFVPRRDSYLH